MSRSAIKKSLIVLLSVSMLLTGCQSTGTPKVDEAPDVGASLIESTDYSLADSWYKIPDENVKAVDTFYIYPTLYSDFSEDAGDYASLHEDMVMEKIDGTYLTQASVFEESTNIYIPYYRQANITIEVDSALAVGDIEPVLKDNLPETDICAALDYYFENYNGGRPFILAGHSQGSAMVRLVLKDYFSIHPEYYKCMVAAYVIGYSVTQKDLDENPHLKFAEGTDDTGVIVSWNTEGEGNDGKTNIVVVDGAISINPINWKRDETEAKSSENLGSLVVDQETGQVSTCNVGADAIVNLSRGVVISHADFPFISETDPNEKAIELREKAFGPESFHNGDYSLFYNNIKENVKARINSYTGDKASDYSDGNNWMKIPEVTKQVDTFYIYPTAFTDTSEDAPTVCEIDNQSMRERAEDIYEQQGTVYEESTNVFAPFYRQVNMAVAATVNDEERDALVQGKGKSDLYAALDYYFENLNEGRPFILAGHSQGAQMLTYILSEYMKEHEEYYARMIAAYVLGYSVTDELLKENPHLRFAERETDTGVIISWNTEGEGNKNQKSFVVADGAISINPLNWKRDETYAGKEENLGARILNPVSGEFEIIPEAADAVLNLERGVILTNTDVMEPMDPALGFGSDSYHGGDYTLFYNNIRENVEKRCTAYFLD